MCLVSAATRRLGSRSCPPLRPHVGQPGPRTAWQPGAEDEHLGETGGRPRACCHTVSLALPSVGYTGTVCPGSRAHWCCRVNVPQTAAWTADIRRLTAWSLEVQEQGVSRARCFRAFCLHVDAVCTLCSHTVSPPCVPGSQFPFLLRAPVTSD